MRLMSFILPALLLAIGGLAACNSNEVTLSQTPKTSATPNQLPTPAPDSARRITATELHDLWVKGDVLIIDTRAEPAYKDEHIKGAISMPTGTVLDRIEELPRNKLIAAYCT